MNYTTAIYVCVSYCEVQLQKYSAGVNINLLLLRSPHRILNLERKQKMVLRDTVELAELTLSPAYS